MPVYFCRWPNGDLSIVAAPNKEEAVIRLDEFGNADGADIVRVTDFLIDFNLTDRGELELSEFGEAAYDRIMEKGYPLLWETMLSDALIGVNENSRKYREIIRASVDAERKRMRRGRKNLPQAKTAAGRKLQAEHDLPASKADRLVKDVLESEEADNSFVN